MKHAGLRDCYGVVYAIRSTESVKVYVGATVADPRMRLWQFRAASRQPQKYRRIFGLVAQAMRDLGPEKFYVEILER